MRRHRQWSVGNCSTSWRTRIIRWVGVVHGAVCRVAQLWNNIKSVFVGDPSRGAWINRIHRNYGEHQQLLPVVHLGTCVQRLILDHRRTPVPSSHYELLG